MNREFINAILLKMAKLLEEHVKNTSPDTVYSDTEIVELLKEVTKILQKNISTF